MTIPRRVLVTGAASGLGAALSRAFLERGDHVLVADIVDDAPVPEGGQAMHLDVTSDADWEAALDRVQAQWNGLDILVNNAGIATGGRIDVATMDEWHRAVEVNLLGAVRGCRTFAPLMKTQGHGTIVNIASLAGLVHPPAMASYTATKAGVVALSETLHHELHPFGVAVAVVCPGFFRTNLAASVASADPVTAVLTSSLIERSQVSADDIAREVLAGLDSGTTVILPDPGSQQAVATKRARPHEYEAQQFAFAERIRQRAGG